MIASTSAIIAGPIVGRLAHDPLRRPVGVTPVRTRHVLGRRRVPALDGRTHVARHPRALVEDLDGGVGDARLDALADEPGRHRVVVLVDLDVIVEPEPAQLPLGVGVGLGRQRL